MKSARARETRIRQPPENAFVGRACMSASKPRPARMTAARAGAASASISTRRSITSASRCCRSASSSCLCASASAACASNSSASPSSSCSSASSASLSMSVASTVCKTDLSPPGTSCSMCRICRLGGMPSNWCAERNFRKVVLPMPLRPISPYFLPETSVRLQSSSSESPLISMLTSLSRMSVAPPPPRQCSTTGSRVRLCMNSSRCMLRSFSRRAARLSSFSPLRAILKRAFISSSVSPSPIGVFTAALPISEL
mmetsp:Transcript_9893/g.21111  ORF Transcript_9893/g.21111 Transcript_9893/m.21111 type:complete len:255 (-) Transcript_9893:415-1179(-)